MGRQFSLALGSALLLVLAFPSLNQPWAAWIGLVPWLLLLPGLRPRAAFWWSYLVGVLFFLGSIWWLVHVTVLGWLILCAFLALYFGVFGVIANRSYTAHPTPHTRLLLLPAAWVALEYIRSHLFTGFGWNLLGYSQTPWPMVLQIADLTGAWGISAVIVLVNASIAECLNRFTTRHSPANTVVTIGIATGVFVSVMGYGAWRLPGKVAPAWRIAVVQGNIPQAHKWDDAYTEQILATYERLTHQAAGHQPQLIVWPETAVPGFLDSDERLTQHVFGIARSVHRPLLVGAPTLKFRLEGEQTFNSAALVTPSGEIPQQYHKVHLVPFGEFIPFEHTAPWLRHLLPPIGDFWSGRDYTVFRSEGQLPFSVLICFEDVFPTLARQFVQRGARALLVITNDGWFGPTAAAYQHAQASTLRAVELRVPVARAANTGWSGCIDPWGRWTARVQDPTGHELFTEGFQACDLPTGPGPTLYQRWGDWFALVCGILPTLWLAVSSYRTITAK